MILFLCGFAILASVMGLDCDEGWYNYPESVMQGKCYKPVNSSMNWKNANYTCVANYDAELVSIHSLEENNFVYDLMKSNGLIATWIGARRASHDFAWADGSNFDYSNWNLEWKQPTYNCAGMGGEYVNKNWGTGHCESPFRIPFICQKESKCNEGWSRDPVTGNCYKFVGQKMSWSDASENCKAQNSSLVSISSGRENKFVYEEVAGSAYVFFIGLYRSSNDSPFQWSDGAPVNYKNWYLNGRRGNCGTMGRKFGGKWMNRNCENLNAFSVCKKNK